MAISLNHYRFGIDELAENTHGWHAAEDTNPASGTIALDTNFLLRFNEQCDGTLLSNVDAEFQYRRNGGTWTNITTTSTFVRAVAVTPLTNGGNCTKRLSGTGTFETTGAGQTEDGTSGGTANDIVANGCSETECGLVLRSADIVGGDKIEFRLTRDGGILFDTYAVVPTLLIPCNGTLSKTLDGIGATQTGTVAVVGAATKTLDGIGLVATGEVPADGASGVLTATLAGIAATLTGTAAVAGTASPTLGGIGLSTAGTAAVVGTAAVTLGGLTGTRTGTVAVTGSAAITLGGFAGMRTGTVAVVGASSPTLAGVGLSTAGTVAVVGVATPTLEGIGLVAAGVVGSQPAEGTLAATLGAMTASAAGVVDVVGSLAAALGGMSLVAAGAVVAGGPAQPMYGPDGSVGNALVNDTPGITHLYSYIPGTTHNG